MEIIFLFVGLGFVAVGALIVVSETRARLFADEVRGELIGFSTGRSGASGASSFYAIARYGGLDRQARYLESSVGSSSPLGSVGDAVTVLVQRGDPEKAEIKSWLTYLMGAGLAAMGLVCCVVFFVTFRISTFSLIGAVAV